MFKFLKYCVVIFLFSCSTQKVISDFDEKVNFKNFNTYNFYEDVGEGLNDFDIKRVIKSLNFELQQNNFSKSDNPDFYINFISKTTEIQNNNTIGVGIGSAGRNGGFGISGGIPIGNKRLNEEFTLEFVNAKTNKPFWAAKINSKIKEKRTPQEKENHFKEIIKKLITNYSKNHNF